MCREGEEVTKNKGEEFVIGKGLPIFELCLMNFDERFLLGCSALKKDSGREMSGSYNFYLWTGTLEQGPREENQHKLLVVHGQNCNIVITSYNWAKLHMVKTAFNGTITTRNKITTYM